MGDQFTLRQKAKKHMWLGIGFSILGAGVQFGALAAMGPQDGMMVAAIGGMLFALLSFVFWLSGCAKYGRSKGHSGILCGFLGIFGLIGLLILVLMPDRSGIGDLSPQPAMATNGPVPAPAAGAYAIRYRW